MSHYNQNAVENSRKSTIKLHTRISNYSVKNRYKIDNKSTIPYYTILRSHNFSILFKTTEKKKRKKLNTTRCKKFTFQTLATTFTSYTWTNKNCTELQNNNEQYKIQPNVNFLLKLRTTSKKDVQRNEARKTKIKSVNLRIKFKSNSWDFRVWYRIVSYRIVSGRTTICSMVELQAQSQVNKYFRWLKSTDFNVTVLKGFLSNCSASATSYKASNQKFPPTTIII